MSGVIKLEEVSRIYGFGNATTVALDEVNLDITKGEFVAIMGPSGSGKSTLLNIAGLLDKPTHGRYYLNKRLVSRFRPNRLAKLRRDNIGFIFQSYNLLPKLTALDNVALPLAYKGVSLTKRLNRASNALKRVGLTDREYFLPGALSGGQSQRVAIARALVNDPGLIIADEPTGNLDSYSSRVVMELIAELHSTGSTVMMVTHNPELTRYASRVLYMIDGVIVKDELTKIGEIPERARSIGSIMTDSNEVKDEVMESVSAYLKEIPNESAWENSITKISKSKHTRSKNKKSRKKKK